MPSFKLTYFDIRGLAEVPRLIFALKGIPYEDVRLPLGSLTPEKKEELNLPWGQVPILEVDGKTLSQSRTIGLYLAKKFDLVGKDEWEEAKVNEMLDAFQLDFAAKWIPMFREKDEAKKELMKKVLVEEETPVFLKRVVAFLKKNGSGFLVGSSVTIADIYAAHFINHFETSFDVMLATGFPEIEALMKKVFDLPGIKEWVATRPKTQW